MPRTEILAHEINRNYSIIEPLIVDWFMVSNAISRCIDHFKCAGYLTSFDTLVWKYSLK